MSAYQFRVQGRAAGSLRWSHDPSGASYAASEAAAVALLHQPSESNDGEPLEYRVACEVSLEPTVRCECGHWCGEPCSWDGLARETRIVQWVPPSLRGSLPPWSLYPMGGSVRLRVSEECAEMMLVEDADWVRLWRPGR